MRSNLIWISLALDRFSSLYYHDFLKHFLERDGWIFVIPKSAVPFRSATQWLYI